MGNSVAVGLGEELGEGLGGEGLRESDLLAVQVGDGGLMVQVNVRLRDGDGETEHVRIPEVDCEIDTVGVGLPVGLRPRVREPLPVADAEM